MLRDPKLLPGHVNPRQQVVIPRPFVACVHAHGHGVPVYTNVLYPFPVDPPRVPNENPVGLYRREFVVLGVLALTVLLVGLWPAPLVEMMSVSVQQLVEQLGHSKLAAL